MVGFEAPPSVKKVVSVVTTVIAGIIGCCLIGAALIEVIVKIVKSRIRG